MQGEEMITTVAHVIQLAVAPVFLLTGIGAFLGVLTNRLGRVVDRSRTLEAQMTCEDNKTERAVAVEFRVLARRGNLINRAISLCTTSALLVCIVIAVLFVGAFLDIDMSIPIGGMFIAAMLALVGGLIYFLREVHHAIKNTSVGKFTCPDDSKTNQG